jgi:hypothetical protein
MTYQVLSISSNLQYQEEWCIPCKIVGVDSRMLDGIFRELTNVRYVPETESNFISLGVLDSCGYKYTRQGGALTLLKGMTIKYSNMPASSIVSHQIRILD